METAPLVLLGILGVAVIVGIIVLIVQTRRKHSCKIRKMVTEKELNSAITAVGTLSDVMCNHFADKVCTQQSKTCNSKVCSSLHISSPCNSAAVVKACKGRFAEATGPLENTICQALAGKICSPDECNSKDCEELDIPHKDCNTNGIISFCKSLIPQGAIGAQVVVPADDISSSCCTSLQNTVDTLSTDVGNVLADPKDSQSYMGFIQDYDQAQKAVIGACGKDHDKYRKAIGGSATRVCQGRKVGRLEGR